MARRNLRRSTDGPNMPPRYCGGGCTRDMNELAEDAVHDIHVGMCYECGERHEARMDEDRTREASRRP